MKFLLHVIFLVAPISLWGQIPKAGDHVKDNNLDPFVGTWVATQGNESLTLVLNKADVFIGGLGYTRQLLIGWHEFKKGGAVIESSLKFQGSAYDKNTTILGSSTGPFSITLTTFRDLSKSRTHNGILVREEANMLKLHIGFAEQVSINKNSQPKTGGITVPSDWLLKRQL